MNKKVFITRAIPGNVVKMLEDAGCSVNMSSKDGVLTHDELQSALTKENYDAVLCLLTDKIDGEIFDAAPTVKLYANYASGFDNIDVVEAGKRGIAVTNAPGDLTSEAVAEHTVALIFALATKIVEADDFMREGKYAGWAPMNFVGMSIFRKTVGLIGAGRIGERVAQYSKALNMKVVYSDIKRNEILEKECEAEYLSTAEEVLKRADFVSLHVPLLPSTHHLIDEARIKMMKQTAFLINTSRGPVVDEVALEKALKEKVIAGAALDVFKFEPNLSEGLKDLKNIILTPHIASASIEARNQMTEVAVKNILDFFEGKTPDNLVQK